MAVAIGLFSSRADFCARSHASNLRLASLFYLISCLLSACSDSGESSDAAQSAGAIQLNTAELIPDSALANPIMASPLANADGSAQDNNIEQTSDLSTRLETQFVLTGQAIVPTSGWICNDVFEQKRTLYFYPEGVIDADRKVLVERTLIADSQFNDVSFFYSVSGPDSLLATSTIVGEQGSLLSSGQQHDINTVRFTDVDTVPSFSAQSVLRGKLVCALFDLD